MVIGAPALSAHLEERVREHLDTQYPKAVDKLIRSLAETDARLEEVAEVAPEDVVHRMLSQMKDTFRAKRTGGSRHIYHNVRAFIKVQHKVISELAAKEMVRTLVLHSERGFNVLVSSQISEYMPYIKEPAHMKRERDALLQRRRVPAQALERVNVMNAGR